MQGQSQFRQFIAPTAFSENRALSHSRAVVLSARSTKGNRIMVVEFSKKYGILVDEQLLMHTKRDLLCLLEQIAIHLRHSPAELELLGRKTFEENHPSMAAQFDFSGNDFQD
jgi:hypothetical protein